MRSKTPYASQPHGGIIVKVATKYWKRLPPGVRAVYDIDDMVQDVVVRVIQAAPKFDTKRGLAGSTFVQCVAQNECATIVNRFNTQKRAPQVVVALDEARAVSARDFYLEFSQRKEPVEHVVRNASVGLRRALSVMIERHEFRILPDTMLAELRDLVKRYGATHDDLREVFAL